MHASCQQKQCKQEVRIASNVRLCMLAARDIHLQANTTYLLSCTVETFHVIVAAHLFRHDMYHHVSKVKHFPAPTAGSASSCSNS